MISPVPGVWGRPRRLLGSALLAGDSRDRKGRGGGEKRCLSVTIGDVFHTIRKYLHLPPAGQRGKSGQRVHRFPAHTHIRWLPRLHHLHPVTPLHLINLHILGLLGSIITHLVQQRDGDARVRPTVHVSHQVSRPGVTPAGCARASVSVAHLQKQS